MAEPVVWKDKDLITAEKLNAMQQVAGPKGDKGDAGATGAQGPKGDTGAAGKDGTAGPKGADGKNGSDAKQIKSGVINEDKNGIVTGITVTFTDNTTVDFSVNKATE
ncbi:collagen-like triple helix repeat-containing protein [Ligilactobacillus acidipiscis]|uniref:collagen-like triple helix repeat-containing protein n=1 Tax=Ligilactobacillus acidipiscis TaxID=89059 RepID=UPI0022E1C247|nr:collagen-like protein [Ligilactobacillus acidipiscis]